MSATYNWAYKPGIANKYGVTINASADDVRPSNACYIAIFGNDTTGNGSRQRPFRTIKKAVDTVSVVNFIIGSGIYRETIGETYATLYGDGDVKIDISYFLGNFSTQGCPGLCNIQLIGSAVNYVGINQINTPVKDCVFDGCSPVNKSSFSVYGISGSVINNFKNIISPIDGGSPLVIIENNTFCNINCLWMSGGGTGATSSRLQNCIFWRCNIVIPNALALFIFKNCVFHECNFSISPSGLSQATASNYPPYPNVPPGFTTYTDIAQLKADVLNAFPTSAAFAGSIIADPKFNNPSIGDFSLAFDSPAKNLSYFGTYVGARSIAQGLKIRAVESDGDFDFSTAVNVTIVDNSITLTDTIQDAVIETKVIENSLGRQLKSIPIIGFNADRNGQYIDSISDLASVTIAAGSALTIPASYIVEVGAITYNSAVYTAGQRFTTVTGQTTFTTVASGVVREILEAPQRHTIEMKLGDVQPFTTETFNHFEPGITPTTNNVGDSRTGAILRGNGDPAFVRGAAVEFPVNSKYIKIRFTIKANNLKP